jgi:NRAMP (natural resistance-associated macrophage protein)-like metal ion transporter
MSSQSPPPAISDLMRRSEGDDASQDPVVGGSKPRLLGVLGPGLITGASDDDPSGIATYSQAGAQLGFTIPWIMLFSYPLMCAMQEISARVGRTTGHGIAGNLRKHYPNWLLQWIVLLLAIANIINLGADLGAMGDVGQMMTGAPHLLFVLLFAIVCSALQIFMQYTRYVSVLKWLTISLFAYFGTAVMVKIPWGQFAWGFFIPHFTASADFFTVATAVLGTTISPYLFFWQSSQEAEDERIKPHRHPLVDAPQESKHAFHRIRLDTYVGMAFANLVALAIIVTTAATLHAKGLTDIESSQQAAEALRPVAGNFAFLIFSLGIVGTGLLAVPVLAGSTAYAVGEARRWKVGLARKPAEAKAFYAVVAIATLIGMIINFTPLNPIKALYWAAVLNGIVSVPVMATMLMMASNTKVMGDFTVNGPLRVIGWIATVVMGVSAVGTIAGIFF